MAGAIANLQLMNTITDSLKTERNMASEYSIIKDLVMKGSFIMIFVMEKG
jgi:hypothetical protein